MVPRATKKVAALKSGLLLVGFLSFSFLLPLLVFPPLVQGQEGSRDSKKFRRENSTVGDGKLVHVQPIEAEGLLKVYLVFDGKVPRYESFNLTGPPRLAIDLKNVQATFAQDIVSLDSQLLERIRVGRYPGKVRVVFDLGSSTGVSYNFMEGEDRIIVSFEPVSDSPKPSAKILPADPKEIFSTAESGSAAAKIRAVDFYSAESGKSLLVVTASRRVQPEVQSTGAKSISLILPRTELPTFLEKPVDTRPDKTAVLSIEPEINLESRGVEFRIALCEAIPYSIKLSGTEIRLEFGPVQESFAKAEEPKNEQERVVIGEVYAEPREPGVDLTAENGQEVAVAIDEELLAELAGAAREEEPEAPKVESAEEGEISDYIPVRPWFSEFMDEVAEGFSYELRILGIETYNKVSGSRANPDNILEIPKYTLQLELRPDFYLNYRRLRLSFRPRNTFTWQKWENGDKSGEDDEDIDLFVNYWLAGLQMTDSLWTSYGRENLQWGPSYLVSPSNPFFANNGLINPKQEVPGQDFGRAVWVPASSFSASFIANTDEGEADFIGDFERTYAVKLDLTGYKKYFSMIGSYRENDRERLGAYGSFTPFGGGLVMYFEGQLSQGTNALYPVETDQTTPTGQPIIALEDTEDDSNSLEYEILVGQSYTFEAGPTITLEYFYNSPGYNDEQAEQILDFADQAEAVLGLPPLLQQQFDLNLEQITNLGLRRLRKNYLMGQYQHLNIRDVFNLVLRYTYNFDDSGSQLNSIVQYDYNDNLQLFCVGIQNFGDKDDEFRFFVDYSYYIGAQYSF